MQEDTQHPPPGAPVEVQRFQWAVVSLECRLRVRLAAGTADGNGEPQH